MSDLSNSSCPVPHLNDTTITLAHGGGGRKMQQLIDGLFVPAFQNDALADQHDGALLEIPTERLAFSTDSHVVKPLFFKGGDIGKLAIFGTVNDLAMCGAKPWSLSVGFILEAGCPMDLLRKVVYSMQHAAQDSGVKIVTGDTKVVDNGSGDSIFINTSGIGILDTDKVIKPQQIRPGDAIVISGDIGRHGMAIMAERESLSFESDIVSDCCNLSPAVHNLLNAGIDIHCLRDCTRGGVATSLVEIANTAQRTLQVEESAFPIISEVKAACEILGMNPLYVANEGCFIAFVPQEQADQTVSIIRQHSFGPKACIIGKVTEATTPQVRLKNTLGIERILDLLSGEQLPRIC